MFKRNLKIYLPEDKNRMNSLSKKKSSDVIFPHRWEHAPFDPYDHEASFRCPCGSAIDCGDFAWYYSYNKKDLICNMNWDIKDIIE